MEVKYKEVPFEVMLKCDGEIKCKHWLLDTVYLKQPMYFNKFLVEIGNRFTPMNCQSIFQDGKWFVIDDGVQPDFFLKKERPRISTKPGVSGTPLTRP